MKKKAALVCNGCGKRPRRLNFNTHPVTYDVYCDICSDYKDAHNGSLMGVERYAEAVELMKKQIFAALDIMTGLK